MKKILFTCFTGMLLSGTITSSYSQRPNGNAKLAYSKEEYTSSLEELNAPKDSASLFLNEISTKAVRNFTRDYKNVSDAKWVVTGNSFSVLFTNDGVHTRILYNKKGDRVWTIRDYTENKLPQDIRHLVKSTYYDFDIYCINEITANGTTCYIIKIQDKTSLKTIKVADDEMFVMKEYKKSE
jgi:hypothetical protein